jgi:hypothetical protein
MGGEYIFQRTDTQGAHGRLRPFGTHEVTETTSAYFPRFGEEIPRDTLRVQYDRAATHSGFALSTNPDSEIAVESTQAGELIVTIDDEHHEIDLTVSDNSPSLTE